MTAVWCGRVWGRVHVLFDPGPAVIVDRAAVAPIQHKSRTLVNSVPHRHVDLPSGPVWHSCRPGRPETWMGPTLRQVVDMACERDIPKPKPPWAWLR